MASRAHVVYAPSLTSEETRQRCCPSGCWQQIASPLQKLAISPALSFGIPTAIGGLRILLLGEGNGQEVFCLAHQAGPAGEVFAVTPNQTTLELWRQWQSEFCQREGFDNLSLLYSGSQSLSQLPLAAASFDLIISLESKVHSLLFDTPYLARLLKTGGEWLRITARQPTRRPAGFSGPFSLASQVVGNHYRATRWFKRAVDASDTAPVRLCYTGGIEDCPDELVFDQYHLKTGQFTALPDDQYQVLINSRYRDYLLPEQKAPGGGLFSD
ncbi:MAG TPA: hypothetical protein PK011_00475 [Marinagarivorans sp.]|nr:hypothetical protein [Cellvibrionaceae bacterium]HMY37769.1 hypothetical protein [Marinagarivorans sp.]HNG58237.1 hypothetical protein [Cellvibrionaceae bacterium]